MPGVVPAGGELPTRKSIDCNKYNRHRQISLSLIEINILLIQENYRLAASHPGEL
jgi:hypothetical protein